MASRVVLILFVSWKSCYASSRAHTVIDIGGEINDNALTLEKLLEQERKDLNFATQQQQQADVECGIWLAPSTIPGAGLGMYAGRDFQKDEEILPTGDSVVAIVDLEAHSAANQRSRDTFLWDEYTWNARSLHASGEGRYSVTMTSPGLGSAANSFLPIVNVEEWYPKKDAAGLHRSSHPSVGSFSPYHDRKSTAKHLIRGGEELFVSYGAQWFKSRSKLGPIPLDDDLDHAQVLINKYKQLQQKLGNEFASNVWDSFVKNTVFKKSRVIGSFHHKDADEMNTLTQTNTTITELRKFQSTHSLSWLREYGTCGDHLAARPSSLIPEAGRGAMATRNLPKGTVVAQLPMIHITNRSILDMYNFENVVDEKNETKYIPSRDSGKMGSQLLLNYCYGHNKSTILLCPYGPLTNFVNHNQSLANVKLTWGRAETGNHMPELLSRPISIFANDSTAKLAMELVAIRDIVEGEEIFLDYGDEWEQAWQEHVRNWNLESDKTYKSAADFNSDNTTRLPTIFEQLNDTSKEFPPNVELKCDYSFVTNPKKWKNHYDNGTMEHFLEFHSAKYRPCIILRSRLMVDAQYFYTVHIYQMIDKEEDDDEDEDDEEEDTNNDAKVIDGNKQPTENRIAKNLPKAALRFFDLAYTDDVFLENAFRHDIRIPDDIFPQIWKNIE